MTSCRTPWSPWSVGVPPSHSGREKHYILLLVNPVTPFGPAARSFRGLNIGRRLVAFLVRPRFRRRVHISEGRAQGKRSPLKPRYHCFFRRNLNRSFICHSECALRIRSRRKDRPLPSATRTVNFGSRNGRGSAQVWALIMTKVGQRNRSPAMKIGATQSNYMP